VRKMGGETMLFHLKLLGLLSTPIKMEFEDVRALWVNILWCKVIWL